MLPLYYMEGGGGGGGAFHVQHVEAATGVESTTFLVNQYIWIQLSPNVQ